MKLIDVMTSMHRSMAHRGVRPEGERWDVFNLETTEALGHVYRTKDEATAAAVALDK